MEKVIFSNCKGNGYIRLSFEAEESIEQCKVCKSQGELNSKEHFNQTWQEPDSPMRTMYFGPPLDPDGFPDYKIEPNEEEKQ